jgi:hypothetical protein
MGWSFLAAPSKCRVFSVVYEEMNGGWLAGKGKEDALTLTARPDFTGPVWILARRNSQD